MIKVPPKHPLPETAGTRAIKAEAIRIARADLKPQHAPRFELHVDELLAFEYLKSGEIQANHRCSFCFGKGTVRKMKNPGVKPLPGTKEELTLHPCPCVLKTYYQRKPSDEVILPAGEYGKPLEPPAEVPAPKAKPKRKKSVPAGDKGTATGTTKTPRVRKNKSSISDQGKD